MAFCSNCGTELKDGAKFCPKCGTRTNVAPAPVEYSYSSDDNEEEEYEELGLGWKIIIFLFWPLGFGIYHSNWESEPYKAHSAITCAGYGILAEIIANIFIFGL
jgi:uncharacterized membrane protein YvbJ